MENGQNLVIPFETPKRGKYRDNKAKDYIIEFVDGKKAYIWGCKDGTEMSILGPGKNLEDCRIGLGHGGVGFIDERKGVYVFYAESYVGHTSGRPIYVGRIIKWRKHTDLRTLSGPWSQYTIAKNKLYFVSSRWENSGFYVIAKTPGAARNLVHWDLDCDYIDSRARRVKIENEERLCGYAENLVIHFDDRHILDDLAIDYYDEDQ